MYCIETVPFVSVIYDGVNPIYFTLSCVQHLRHQRQDLPLSLSASYSENVFTCKLYSLNAVETRILFCSQPDLIYLV